MTKAINLSTAFVQAKKTLVAVATIFAMALPLHAAPDGKLPFGVYDPDGVFANDTGVTIEHLFLPWEDVFLPSLIDADAYAAERGRSILVTIEPWTWNRSERNTPEHLLQGLSSGEYDQYMSSICAVLNLFNSSVTVRWAQEMEDTSGQFIWAQWDPENYMSAYKRMVDVCRVNAPEINFMWSPLGYEGLDLYYPGDEYVDIVGISVFGLQAWELDILGHEQSFKDIVGPRYERVVGFGKPVVVAELGYVGDQGYVDKWNSEVRLVYPEFPELVAVVYFNQKEVYPWPDNHGKPNWKFEAHVVGD